MDATSRNVGPLDRLLRVVLGLALLAIAGPDRAWAFIGVFPLATGFAGRCPFYSLLGVGTCGRGHRRSRAP